MARKSLAITIACLACAAAAVSAFAQSRAEFRKELLSQDGQVVEMVNGSMPAPTDEMSPLEHARIMDELEQNRIRLVNEGKLSREHAKVLTNFAWPLRQAAGRTDNGYFGIANYVDEDPAYPNHLLDYNCGTRTYDLSSGYNHQGTDIFTTPWSWKKMDDQDVVIQAGAPGTIIGKTDGNFDRSCAMNNNTWNSVYVQHADGSVAWYGHMKSGSPTVKAVGDTVALGEYLGTVGSSGSSTGPHLHLELYDSTNHLADPWLGACNALSKQVTWATQRPYRVPIVNTLTVGTAAPVFPACPSDETPNTNDYPASGSTVYFTAYVTDQTNGMPISIRILRPNNTVYDQQTGTANQDYAWAYWYWYYSGFPATAGTWTFEVTFNSQVYTKTFVVNGSPGYGAPASFAIQGGSSQTAPPKAVFPNPIAVLVTDAQGHPVPKAKVTFTLPTSGATAIMDSPTALTDANGLASVGLRANKTAGAYNATVAVAGIAATQNVGLVNGTGTQLLSASPASLDFGGQSMNTTSPAQTSTLTNASGNAVSITAVTAATGYGVTHNCPASLPNGGTCTLTVTFTPTVQSATTAQPGTILVFYAGGGPTVISLTGIAEKTLVTHYYRAILRRAPDAGGKPYWEGEAARMQGLGANINETWFAMAMYFFFSSEYVAFNRDDTGFVTDLYTTFFNRAPDSGGLQYWVGQIGSGMPREVVLAGFMFSPEFVSFTQAIFGNTSARAEVDVVGDFYRGLLARLPDNGGFNTWVGNFRTAQCQGASQVSAMADAISSGFITGSEYTSKNRSNPQFVGDLYNAFLRRSGDLAGVQFWISQLATSALTRDKVRQNFVASTEFTGRVSSVISQGCYPGP